MSREERLLIVEDNPLIAAAIEKAGERLNMRADVATDGWEAIEKLRSEGWLQAVASSAPRLNLDTIIEALSLSSFFAAIASAEDVTAGKPDPQVFLAAARKVGVEPSRCVVVEDAPAGTEAARRARMRSIGVLSSHTELRADTVVRSLEDLPVDAFDQLLAGK